MNWPQGLLNIFNVARNQNVPFESRYYGPYISLLNYALVDDTFSFFISPQISPNEDTSYEAEGPVMFLVVFNLEHKPVLFAEIRDDGWVNRPNKCLRADYQMHSRCEELLLDCSIPRLYGLSLLGTSLRVYCADTITSEVTPDPIALPNRNYVVPRNFFVGEWNLDILSLDGLKKMQQIVAYIKAEDVHIMKK